MYTKVEFGVLTLPVPSWDSKCLDFVLGASVKIEMLRAEMDICRTDLTVSLSLKKSGYQTDVKEVLEKYTTVRQKYLEELEKKTDEYLNRFGPEYVIGVNGWKGGL